MKHRHILPFLILAFFSVTALAACSTPPIKKADKNFERAWLAFTSLRTDKAIDYFEEAAAYYEEAISQDSRVADYPSSRVKAGMALYFAGRYEQCIDSMAASHHANERIWEADLFTGLAYARLGDAEHALKNLTLFMDGRPSPRQLFEAVKEQASALDEGGASLDHAADTLEKAMQNQMIAIIKTTLSTSTVKPDTEKCSGPFWWRRNKQPCSTAGEK